MVKWLLIEDETSLKTSQSSKRAVKIRDHDVCDICMCMMPKMDDLFIFEYLYRTYIVLIIPMQNYIDHGNRVFSLNICFYFFFFCFQIHHVQAFVQT